LLERFRGPDAGGSSCVSSTFSRRSTSSCSLRSSLVMAGGHPRECPGEARPSDLGVHSASERAPHSGRSGLTGRERTTAADFAVR
jgi:hypothetical protein